MLVQCGCLNKGRRYYNGYSVLLFNAQENKATIYLRSYFDDRSKFDKAVNKCEDGILTIELEKDKTNIEKNEEGWYSLIDIPFKIIELLMSR